MKCLRTLILVISALFSTCSWSKEIRWTHFGQRPLGMGNAYVAVADDYNALFYNPAGLARIKEWDGELINPAFEIAKATVDFTKELSTLQAGSTDGISKVLDIFQGQTGKVHHGAMYMTPHFIMRNWGLGIGMELSASLVTHSNINIEFDAGMKSIMPLTYAMNFLDDKLSIGASLKFLARSGIDHSFTIQTISLFSSDSEDGVSKLFEAGYGYGLDIGMLFTPIETMEPTLGISIVDFGGSKFTAVNVSGSSNNNPRAPATRLPAVNTGVSIKPIMTDAMYVMAAVDAHVINRPEHFSHKFNLGLEWGYSDIIKIQAGLKEGYATAGFQFDVGLLNMRFTSYAVDHAPIVGTHNDLVERRYALQIKLLI